MKSKKIVLCGNYGIGNLGDEAIGRGLIRLVNSAWPSAQITMLSAQKSPQKMEQNVKLCLPIPAGWRSCWKSLMTGEILRTLRAIWQADLFILGGGGLFTDENPRAIWIWFWQAFGAYLLGKKLVFLGQSVGPIKTKWAKFLTAWIFKKAQLVSVRDTSSQHLLHQMGVNKVLVNSDAALALSYEIPSYFNQEDYIVLSLRPWPGKNIDQLLGELVDWLWQDLGLKTIAIPFQILQENDLERFAHLKAKNLEVNITDSDLPKTLEIIAKAKLLVGMRLHALIFATITKTPFVAFSYSQKVRNMTEELGMSEFCLDYSKLDLAEIKAKIKTALEERSHIKKNLEKVKLQKTYQFFELEKLLQSLSG